jgi:hypothetical protein
MTAATASTSLFPVQPAFTDAERLALAGFLAGYRGRPARPTPWTCARSPAGAAPGPCRCSPSAAPTSRPSPPRTGSTRACPRHGHAAAVHHRGVLQIRRRGRTPRPLPGRARPPPAADYESHATALDRNELGALLVGQLLPVPQHEYGAFGPEPVAQPAGSRDEHRQADQEPMETPSTRSSGTESSREMVGSATFTIVVSMIVMNMATAYTTLTVTLGLIWRAVISLMGLALRPGAVAGRLLLLALGSSRPA